MKEIEIKAHLKNKEKVLEKLKELGCVFSDPVRQIDTVYAKNIETVEDYLKNDHFVRIRIKDDGRSVLTVKKPLSTKVLTKIEHETEVKNAEELEQALFLMGYQIANKVIKTRYTTHFKDFTICLDEVENMGSFIEIEKMSDEDEGSVRKELNDFLNSLDIPSGDEVHKGYDIMAIEKQRGE